MARARPHSSVSTPGRGGNPAERRGAWLTFYEELALSRGGVCLSTEYVSAHHSMQWRCAAGHVWAAVPNAIKHGRWCPACANAHRHDAKKARNFEKVTRIAKERGGRCVSTTYVDSQTHLRWECELGHQWEAVPNSIAIGTWCPFCAGKHLTIDDMQVVARARGGECLSPRYTNVVTKLRWRCAEGHEWEAIPDNVLDGRWCPHCAGVARLTLDRMHEMAKERGGQCLSKRYVDVVTKLRWRCAAGHEFSASANAVQQGGWCPTCRSASKGDIERFRKIARRRGGECLSPEYVDSKTKLAFRCGWGHEWETTPELIASGTWCPTCSVSGGVRPPLSIEEMQELAESRGGRCLSRVYVNARTKLLWRCHAGHEWEADPAAVKHTSWCPICARRYTGSIGGMQALATDRGGRCLSRVYDGHRTILEFECARGHRFRMTGREANTGLWCSMCTTTKRARKDEAAAAKR